MCGSRPPVSSVVTVVIDSLLFPAPASRSTSVPVLPLFPTGSQKMLHRDLKTGNVFLTSTGVVKLGDFGISTSLMNTAAVAHTVCGTPNYFSPEMCQGVPPLLFLFQNALPTLWYLTSHPIDKW